MNADAAPPRPAAAAPPRPKLFYGWIVVAIAFVTMAVAITGRTAYSLLLPEIIGEFGWSTGVTSGAFAVGFIATTFIMAPTGMLMDRYGPRLVIPLAAVLVAVGFVLATALATPLELYLSLGVLVTTCSVGMSYIGHSMFLPNWFVRRRGLAIGIAFAGVGIGGVVMLPVLQLVIDDFGWRAACFAMAAAIAVIVIPLNVLFQRRSPADLGLEPDGDARAGSAAAGVAASRSPDPVVDRVWAERRWTLSSAMRTARFWWVCVAFFGGLFVWYALQVHQTRFLIGAGFSTGEAALALGLVAFCGLIGQIALGGFSDRFGRELAWTLAMAGFALAAACFIVLGRTPSTAALYGAVALQGLLGYGAASIYGAIPAELFAGRRFASIFAMATLGGNFGAAAGAWSLGAIYDRTGSYETGFAVCIVMSMMSIVAVWLAAPRRVRLVAGQARRRPRAG